MNQISKAAFTVISLALLTQVELPTTAQMDHSYESDRGYREPAVLGPAIVDESVPIAIDSEFEPQENMEASEDYEAIHADVKY